MGSIPIVGSTGMTKNQSNPPHSATSDRLWLVLLYCWSVSVWGFLQYIRVTTDPDFIGEEVWFGYRNVRCFDFGIQSGPQITSYSGILLYWLASHLFPVTFFSTRVFKVITVSLLPVMMVLFLRRLRPGTLRTSEFFLVTILLFLPPVAWYAVIPLENFWECLFGFFAMYLALGFSGHVQANSRSVASVIGFYVLCIFIPHLYPSSFALLIPALGIIFGKFWSAHRTNKRALIWHLAGFAGFIALAAAGSLWPLLVMKTRPLTMFVGGGHSILTNRSFFSLFDKIGASWEAWTEFAGRTYFNDFFYVSESYLLASWIPYGAFPIYRWGAPVVLLAIASLLLIRQNKLIGWLVLGGFINAAILFFSSGYSPGIRRAAPLACLIV
ncbi:MAG: hypothetical protein KDD44_11575, partial [Bdellovibrionales bacterium]|nr:hypothetical protein [Bdellovibrionales bacterium]